MFRIFKRFEAYRKKRVLAHQILKELLPEKDADIHKEGGTHYFVTKPDGSMIIQFEGTGLRKLERGYCTISVFRNHFKQYTEKEIIDALNLLIINGHVEVEDKSQHKSFETIGFSLSPKGRLAYDDEFYLNQKAEQANREIANIGNWFTPLTTLIVAFSTLVVSAAQCLNSNTSNITKVEIRMDSVMKRYITSPPFKPSKQDLKKADSQYLK